MFPERPSKDKTSEKGKEAVLADRMLQKGTELANWGDEIAKAAWEGGVCPHGESSRQPVQETLHEAVGEDQNGQERRRAL